MPLRGVLCADSADKLIHSNILNVPWTATSKGEKSIKGTNCGLFHHSSSPQRLTTNSWNEYSPRLGFGPGPRGRRPRSVPTCSSCSKSTYSFIFSSKYSMCSDTGRGTHLQNGHHDHHHASYRQVPSGAAIEQRWSLPDPFHFEAVEEEWRSCS